MEEAEGEKGTRGAEGEVAEGRGGSFTGGREIGKLASQKPAGLRSP